MTALQCLKPSVLYTQGDEGYALRLLICTSISLFRLQSLVNTTPRYLDF